MRLAAAGSQAASLGLPTHLGLVCHALVLEGAARRRHLRRVAAHRAAHVRAVPAVRALLVVGVREVPAGPMDIQHIGRQASSVTTHRLLSDHCWAGDSLADLAVAAAGEDLEVPAEHAVVLQRHTGASSASEHNLTGARPQFQLPPTCVEKVMG